MFGIGDTELILILIFAFLLFGPDKLPELGKTLGKGLKRFQNAQDSVNKVVQEQVIDPVQQAAQKTSQQIDAVVNQENQSVVQDDETMHHGAVPHDAEHHNAAYHEASESRALSAHDSLVEQSTPVQQSTTNQQSASEETTSASADKAKRRRSLEELYGLQKGALQRESNERPRHKKNAQAKASVQHGTQHEAQHQTQHEAQHVAQHDAQHGMQQHETQHESED